VVLLERVLLLDLPVGLAGDVRRAALDLVLRWQQLTGPAMAKGFEDTAFYAANRLVSLNEVGADVHTLEHPRGRDAFHAGLARRGGTWPHALNTTSTHDTKRSEDVRARLQVLTEVPEAWAAATRRWSRRLARHRRDVGDHVAPDPNEEWLLYQTLVGVWPLHRDDEAEVLPRVRAFMHKAGREAKAHTSWLDPDEEHEAAVAAFVEAAVGDQELVDDVRAVVDRIAVPGATNSLAQVVLRMAAPGVPDTYQGSELWDLSLVDPDNRRPVDYDRRRRLLAELRAAAAGDGARLADLVRESWRDGRVKLLVTWRCLDARRRWPALFRDGDYHPLEVEGPLAEHVVAFARRHRDGWIAAAVPRLTAGIGGNDGWAVGGVWGGTALRLPEAGAGRPVRDHLTDRRLDPDRVLLAEVFGHLPVALLTATG
jgi:(1->4)-alpha-D-glucan 1-alpha-D-glucosylmutase